MPLPASSDVTPSLSLDSLARRLSAADERLVVWKGGRELAAQGDLDCGAAREAWPALAAAFETWARERGLAATLACDHALGMLVLVGCGGSAGARLVQVDLVDTLLVHGAPAWTARDALAAAACGGEVPHTLPGAEGVLRRLADRSDHDAMPLVAADPGGAAVVADRLGLRGRLAAHDGGVSTRIALEGILYLRPFVHARSLARARRSDAAREACVVLRALRNDRTIAGDVEAWLADASDSHRVRRVEAGG